MIGFVVGCCSVVTGWLVWCYKVFKFILGVSLIFGIVNEYLWWIWPNFWFTIRYYL